jgi:hypothetical protein
LLDGLEEEGIVGRIADTLDRRGKFVRCTEKGLAALRDGDRIKFAIEARYRKHIGRARFAALMDALRNLESKHEPHEAVDAPLEEPGIMIAARGNPLHRLISFFKRPP